MKFTAHEVAQIVHGHGAGHEGSKGDRTRERAYDSAEFLAFLGHTDTAQDLADLEDNPEKKAPAEERLFELFKTVEQAHRTLVEFYSHTLSEDFADTGLPAQLNNQDKQEMLRALSEKVKDDASDLLHGREVNGTGLRELATVRETLGTFKETATAVKAKHKALQAELKRFGGVEEAGNLKAGLDKLVEESSFEEPGLLKRLWRKGPERIYTSKAESAAKAQDVESKKKKKESALKTLQAIFDVGVGEIKGKLAELEVTLKTHADWEQERDQLLEQKRQIFDLTKLETETDHRVIKRLRTEVAQHMNNLLAPTAGGAVRPNAALGVYRKLSTSGGRESRHPEYLKNVTGIDETTLERDIDAMVGTEVTAALNRLDVAAAQAVTKFTEELTQIIDHDPTGARETRAAIIRILAKERETMATRGGSQDAKKALVISKAIGRLKK